MPESGILVLKVIVALLFIGAIYGILTGRPAKIGLEASISDRMLSALIIPALMVLIGFIGILVILGVRFIFNL